MLDMQMMLPIGAMLQGGKYHVVRYMASGGFGNTYEVEHTTLGKRMALKEFFIRGVNVRSGLSVTIATEVNRTTFEQMRTKFYKEARRLATLDNMHIVEVSDFFEENDTVYYVMKLINGGSLASTMKQMGHAFTEKQVDNVFHQILSALKLIHHQGLYHLDLKPDNIMHNDEGHCWLIDFGASKQLTYEQTMTMATTTGLCYTPGYAPSEQVSCNTKRIGPWTDFYSLGATLYNLLTNEAPPSPDDILFDGKKVFRFPNDISISMRNMVMWLMNVKPQDRPQSVEEIEEKISSSTSYSTPAMIIPKKKHQWTKSITKEKQNRWKVIMALAAIGMLLGVTITIFVWRDNLEPIPPAFKDSVTDFYAIVDSTAIDELVDSTLDYSVIDEDYYHDSFYIDENGNQQTEIGNSGFSPSQTKYNDGVPSKKAEKRERHRQPERSDYKNGGVQKPNDLGLENVKMMLEEKINER